MFFYYYVQPTAMRIHPYYSLYNNYARLICLGIIPFVMLIYLNFKIYQDIQARKNRRFNSRYREKELQYRRLQHRGTNCMCYITVMFTF